MAGAPSPSAHIIPGYDAGAPLRSWWLANFSRHLDIRIGFPLLVYSLRDARLPLTAHHQAHRGVPLEVLLAFVPDCFRTLGLWASIARDITMSELSYLAQAVLIVARPSIDSGLVVLFGTVRRPASEAHHGSVVGPSSRQRRKRHRCEGPRPPRRWCCDGVNAYSIISPALQPKKMPPHVHVAAPLEAPASVKAAVTLLRSESARLDLAGVGHETAWRCREQLSAAAGRMSSEMSHRLVRTALDVIFARMDKGARRAAGAGGDLFGCSSNMQALTQNISRWLCCVPHRDDVPLDDFLVDVRVGQIPWAREAVFGRAHRSLLLTNATRPFVRVLIEELLGRWMQTLFHAALPTRSKIPLFLLKVQWKAIAARTKHQVIETLQLRAASSASLTRAIAGSPLRINLLCSSITLRPDGDKLRPVAIVASTKAASCYVRSPPDGAQLSIASRRFRDAVDTNRKRTFTGRPTEGVTLREAAGCLAAGRRLCSATRVSCGARNHTSERLQWEAFASLTSSERVYMFKTDATKCFDMIPQAVVRRKIDEWLCDATFFAWQGSRVDTGDERHSCLTQSSWSYIVSEREISDQALPNVPSGWVVSLERSERLDGAFVRELLLHHTQQHLVTLNGRFFHQHRGITQGSPVAPILCDGCFEDIDAMLASVLEQHCSPYGLVLRRLDDILVVTPCRAAFDAALQSVVHGVPDVGYTTNTSKLKVATNVGDEVPWCGLVAMVRSTGLTLSVDWRRFVPCQATPGMRSDASLLGFTAQVLRSLRLRLPVVLFDRVTINADGHNTMEVVIAACAITIHGLVVTRPASGRGPSFAAVMSAVSFAFRQIPRLAVAMRATPPSALRAGMLRVVEMNFSRITNHSTKPRVALWCVAQRRLLARAASPPTAETLKDAAIAVAKSPLLHPYLH